MIKYIIAVPLVLLAAFTLGGFLSHLPIPFTGRGGRDLEHFNQERFDRERFDQDRSYGFYLGSALFIGLVGLAIGLIVDGYFLISLMFFAIGFVGGGIAALNFLRCLKTDKTELDVKNTEEQKTKSEADNCCEEIDEKNELDKNQGDVSCDEDDKENDVGGRKDDEKDENNGIKMRLWNNIAETVAKKLLFVSVVLCITLAISIVFSVIFVTAFRPLDSGLTVTETVVFTNAEPSGNVLFLYTEDSSDPYVVFGYREWLSDYDGFIARVGCEGACEVGSIAIELDEWRVCKAVQSLTDESGNCLLTAEVSAVTRKASVDSVITAFCVMNGMLALVDGFCFFLYFRKKKADRV